MGLSSRLYLRRVGSLCAILVISLLGVTLISASALAGSGLSYLGSTAWSKAIDVVVDDSLAYVAMASGLQIFDLSDPSRPTPISQVFLSGGYATDIAKSGDTVCISGWGKRTYVIDGCNPLSPYVVREFATPESAYGVDIEDSLVAIAWGSDFGTSGITVHNLRDPDGTPGMTASLDFVPIKLRFRTGFIFAVGGGVLVSVQVQPDTLSVADSLITSYFPIDLDSPSNDTLIYLADRSGIQPAGWSAFSAVDATDPANLSVVGQKRMRGYCAGVTATAQTAYAAFGCRGLHILDISDPAVPDSIGNISLAYFAGKVSASENLLVVTDVGPTSGDIDFGCWGEGPSYSPVTLPVYDIMQPTQPVLLGSYEMPGLVTKLAVSGNIVCTFNSGGVSPMVQVIDASDPTKPQVLSSFNTLGVPYLGVIVDTLLFMATDSTLEVANIADPSHPTLIGHGIDVNPACGIAVRLPYVFLANDFSYLTIWDVSDPVHPAKIGTGVTPGRANDVAVSGNYAYVGGGVLYSFTGVQVFDISDLAHPQPANLTGSLHYHRIVVSGNRLAALDMWNGFDLFSLADPAQPAIVGEYRRTNLLDEMGDVAIGGQYAFVACADPIGLRVVSLTPADSLRAVDSIATPGSGFGVTLEGQHVYVADRYGMIILDGGVYTDVKETNPFELPRDFALHQNYPNPFNPATIIEYDIPRRSFVGIEVFNLQGQKVTTLVSQVQSAGRHRTELNGDGLASGVYFYRLLVDEVPQGAKKMVLLK